MARPIVFTVGVVLIAALVTQLSVSSNASENLDESNYSNRKNETGKNDTIHVPLVR